MSNGHRWITTHTVPTDGDFTVGADPSWDWLKMASPLQQAQEAGAVSVSQQMCTVTWLLSNCLKSDDLSLLGPRMARIKVTLPTNWLHTDSCREKDLPDVAVGEGFLEEKDFRP